MVKGRSETAGLVPDSFEDFRSLRFWDGFFDTRGDTPFEWYGDWRQLQSFLKPLCTTQTEVLVAGCGNSDLSAELYDSGCEQITNVDFSRKVIASMMAKNIRRRPRMKWKVGDITALKMEDAGFDVVLDKGGLDALMGEDSEEGTQAGRLLLKEAERVLRPGGCYICVTLAQPHVLSLLLDSHRHGWKLEFAAIPPAPDMARAALQPVFVVATKTGNRSRLLESTIRPSARAPNAEQLADICRMIQVEQAAREENEAGAQNGSASNFNSLYPGRSVRLNLPQSSAKSNPAARFTATVVDVEGRSADASTQLCCVFLVPQGREDEWLFASDEGRCQVAAQCSGRRVIFVAMNRGHIFGDTAAVQRELSPLVRPLAPLGARSTEKAIPVMTTAEGVGRRHELESVQSAISGRIIAEDVVLEEDGRSRAVRRLIFAANRHLVQSEAVLRGGPEADAQPGKQAARRGSKGGSKKKREAAKPAQLDSNAMQPDLSILAMQYHNLIVAGICAGSCLDGDSRSRAKAFVVGLGGGGLAVFLHEYIGMDVRVAELDPAVLEIAQRHFGFQNASGLQAEVADGLIAIKEAAGREPDSLDALIVDAGSSDASLAMSCPPPAFLKESFLRDAATILRPEGLLVMNCVTRLGSAQQSAITALQGFFENVYTAEVEDYVNCVLFATARHIAEAALKPNGIGSVLERAVKGRHGLAESVADRFAGLKLCERTS